MTPGKANLLNGLVIGRLCKGDYLNTCQNGPAFSLSDESSDFLAAFFLGASLSLDSDESFLSFQPLAERLVRSRALLKLNSKDGSHAK